MPRAARQRPPTIPTAIVDKSALFRAGLEYSLAETQFRVVASYATLNELPFNAFTEGPCLLLFGFDREPRSASPQVLGLREHNKYLRVVVFGDQLDGNQLLAAIDMGGDCYVLKNEITPELLLKNLDIVISGKIICPLNFIKALDKQMPLLTNLTPIDDKIGSYNHLIPDTHMNGWQAQVRLSNREDTVLHYLMRGASNKHIARELQVAEATVKVHVKSVLRKVGARNRTQAAMWGWSHVSDAEAAS